MRICNAAGQQGRSFFPCYNNVAMAGNTCIIHSFHSYKPVNDPCYVLLLLLKLGNRQRFYKLRCEDGLTMDALYSPVYAERLNELFPIVFDLLRASSGHCSEVHAAACCFYARRRRVRRMCRMRYFREYYVPPIPIVDTGIPT